MATTISDTLYLADDTPITGGKITIAPKQAFQTRTGRQIVGSSIAPVTVNADGSFTVTLEPNTTAIPSGTSYSVVYAVTANLTVYTYSETWTVPDSANILKLADVRTAPSAGTLIPVQLSQLTQPGVQPNFLVTWDSTLQSFTAKPASQSFVFNNATMVTVTNAQHGFGTPNLLFAVYDNATPQNLIQAKITVDPVSFTAVATFAVAQSGTIVIFGR